MVRVAISEEVTFEIGHLGMEKEPPTFSSGGRERLFQLEGIVCTWVMTCQVREQKMIAVHKV